MVIILNRAERDTESFFQPQRLVSFRNPCQKAQKRKERAEGVDRGQFLSHSSFPNSSKFSSMPLSDHKIC